MMLIGIYFKGGPPAIRVVQSWGRGASTATRLVEVKYDDNKQPILPIEISSSLKLISLGEVVYDRLGYHNARYIFPVGFKTEKLYTSLADVRKKCIYTSEILVSRYWVLLSR